MDDLAKSVADAGAVVSGRTQEPSPLNTPSSPWCPRATVTATWQDALDSVEQKVSPATMESFLREVSASTADSLAPAAAAAAHANNARRLRAMMAWYFLRARCRSLLGGGAVPFVLSDIVTATDSAHRKALADAAAKSAGGGGLVSFFTSALKSTTSRKNDAATASRTFGVNASLPSQLRLAHMALVAVRCHAFRLGEHDSVAAMPLSANSGGAPPAWVCSVTELAFVPVDFAAQLVALGSSTITSAHARLGALRSIAGDVTCGNVPAPPSARGACMLLCPMDALHLAIETDLLHADCVGPSSGRFVGKPLAAVPFGSPRASVANQAHAKSSAFTILHRPAAAADVAASPSHLNGAYSAAQLHHFYLVAAAVGAPLVAGSTTDVAAIMAQYGHSLVDQLHGMGDGLGAEASGKTSQQFALVRSAGGHRVAGSAPPPASVALHSVGMPFVDAAIGTAAHLCGALSRANVAAAPSQQQLVGDAMHELVALLYAAARVRLDVSVSGAADPAWCTVDDVAVYQLASDAGGSRGGAPAHRGIGPLVLDSGLAHGELREGHVPYAVSPLAMLQLLDVLRLGAIGSIGTSPPPAAAAVGGIWSVRDFVATVNEVLFDSGSKQVAAQGGARGPAAFERSALTWIPPGATSCSPLLWNAVVAPASCLWSDALDSCPQYPVAFIAFSARVAAMEEAVAGSATGGLRLRYACVTRSIDAFFHSPHSCSSLLNATLRRAVPLLSAAEQRDVFYRLALGPIRWVLLVADLNVITSAAEPLLAARRPSSNGSSPSSSIPGGHTLTESPSEVLLGLLSALSDDSLPLLGTDEVPLETACTRLAQSAEGDLVAIALNQIYTTVTQAVAIGASPGVADTVAWLGHDILCECIVSAVEAVVGSQPVSPDTIRLLLFAIRFTQSTLNPQLGERALELLRLAIESQPGGEGSTAALKHMLHSPIGLNAEQLRVQAQLLSLFATAASGVDRASSARVAADLFEASHDAAWEILTIRPRMPLSFLSAARMSEEQSDANRRLPIREIVAIDEPPIAAAWLPEYDHHHATGYMPSAASMKFADATEAQRFDALRQLLAAAIGGITVAARLDPGHVGRALVLLHRVDGAHGYIADPALKATCASCSALLRAPSCIGEVGLSTLVGEAL